MVEIGPVIQGLAAAGGILMLVVLYVDRMSTVSKSLDDLSDSMSDVRDDLHRVDLKEMEKTTNKLDTFLKAELQQQYGPENTRTGGQNSVRHKLESVDIDITISYVGDPDWHSGIRERDDWEGAETVFEIEFDEEVDTQGLVGMIAKDKALQGLDENVFKGDKTRITADSPFQISVAVPTSDMEISAEWIHDFLQRIDSHIEEMRSLSEQFDKAVENELYSESS